MNTYSISVCHNDIEHNKLLAHGLTYKQQQQLLTILEQHHYKVLIEEERTGLETYASIVTDNYNIIAKPLRATTLDRIGLAFSGILAITMLFLLETTH